MLDVLVAGAGPAGAIASLVLARAGARVLVVDRDAFPRDKLCGDTLNPGAVSLLASLGLTGGPLRDALPLAGMIVTGPHASVEGRYPEGCRGLALTRRTFDAWLLEHAIRAGARFEGGLVIRAPLLEDGRVRSVVRGLQLARRGDGSQVIRLPATVTIAADGRRSVTARALGLIRHPPRPRRWAYGTYATGVAGVRDIGEMHIRRGFYLGIAPIGAGRCNVCVVSSGRPAGATPLDVIRRAVAADPAIAARFTAAEYEPRVRVLGPLAVDALACGADGLLLAGDASGFVDPMTGDGLHLAMRGATLAAEEALRVLADGRFAAAPERLRRAREQAFGRKLRFNRFLRTLVGSPSAVTMAAGGARLAPGLVRRAVYYAGDAA
jgi:flavin-dependent dehydrogenase